MDYRFLDASVVITAAHGPGTTEVRVQFPAEAPI